jgi:hypothetical protein
VPSGSTALRCEANTGARSPFSQITVYVPCHQAGPAAATRSSGGRSPPSGSTRSTYVRPTTSAADHPNRNVASSFQAVTVPSAEISTTATRAPRPVRRTSRGAPWRPGAPSAENRAHTRLLVGVYSTPQVDDREVVIRSPRPCSAVSGATCAVIGRARPGCRSSTSTHSS